MERPKSVDLYQYMTHTHQIVREALLLLNDTTGRVASAVGMDLLKAKCPTLEASLSEAWKGEEALRIARDAPELTLATTGTTSAGKSTIINFLVGASIMPVTVQEKSAGIVEIIHDDARRSLRVLATPQATWPTGTYDDISDEDIRDRLAFAMDAWRVLRERDPANVPPAPKFELRYPTRIGRDPKRFGLPAGIRVRLLDLPGLRTQNDDTNGRSIREGAHKALCLVAYDAKETDETKQKKLLDEVVAQVKDLGGSPGRMLFILNRIDVFDQDGSSGAAQRDQHVSTITQRIRQALQKELFELHHADISAIVPLPFASMPASLVASAEALPFDERRERVLDAVDLFGYLVPRSLRRQVGFDPDEGDLNVLMTTLFERSHGPAFERRLGEHVAQHLPAIVVPPLLQAIDAPAQQVVISLKAVLDAAKTARHGTLKEQQERLEATGKALEAVRGEVVALARPFRAVSSTTDTYLALQDAVGEVQAAVISALAREKLHIAEHFLDALQSGGQTLARRISDMVEPFLTGALDLPVTLPEASGKKLLAAHSALRDGEAGRFLTRGGTFKSTDDSAVRRVKAQYQAFFRALAEATSLVVTREAEHVANHGQEALATLTDAMARLYAHRSIAACADADLSGVASSALPRIDLPPLPQARVTFRPDLDVVRESYERFVGTRKVRTGSERRWTSLWLVKHDTFRDEPVYETTTEFSVDLPPLHDMLATFFDEADEGIAKHATELEAGILRALQIADDAMKRHTQAQFKQYQSILQGLYADFQRMADADLAAIEAVGGEVERSEAAVREIHAELARV